MYTAARLGGFDNRGDSKIQGSAKYFERVHTGTFQCCSILDLYWLCASDSDYRTQEEGTTLEGRGTLHGVRSIQQDPAARIAT